MSAGQPFAHPGRHPRLHDGDAEAGCDRGCVERPHIDGGAAQPSGESRDHHAEYDGELGAAAGDQERSRDGGDGEQSERKSDQKPDLGF